MPHLMTASGLNWHYEVEGEGDTIVFLHGWGVNGRIWRQQIKYFSDSYQVIYFDLPGHGESTWKKVPLEVMAHDLIEIFDKLGWDQVTIVGSSLGGMFSMKIFDLSPGKIKKMVFVGSMPKFSQSEDYPHGIEVARIRKLSGQLDSAYPSIVNVFFRSLFTKEERESRRFKWLQRFRQTDVSPMKPALVEYLDILEQEDLRDVLERINRPVQFINGAEDNICTKATVEYLRSIKPRARFDEFAQCGHFPFLSKPHEFNQILEEFLKED